MTDPFDDEDLATTLHRYGAAASRHAQPPPAADIRSRARRRGRSQLVGITTATAVVVLGAGTAIANSSLMEDRTGAPVGPAAPSASTSEPAPTSTTAPGPTPTPDDALPADYPLLSFVDDPGGDGSIDGPASTVSVEPIKPCGRRVWNPRGLIDQVAVRNNMPEQVQIRQIVLFDDAAAAQTAIDDVRDAFESCPAEQTDGSFGLLHEVSEPDLDSTVKPDLGPFGLAVSSRSTYDQDPALAIGLTEMRWAKINNAVIFTYDTSEAMGDATGPGREADQRVATMVTTWCDSAPSACG